MANDIKQQFFSENERIRQEIRQNPIDGPQLQDSHLKNFLIEEWVIKLTQFEKNYQQNQEVQKNSSHPTQNPEKS